MTRFLGNQANDDGVISFSDYVRHALYAPEIGYYRKKEALRVGRERGTDFYTSTSVGPVFAKLIVASTVKLLHPEPPNEYIFVEIGAEPKNALLNGIDHPFADCRVFRLGDSIQLPEKAVVFSNEWLDAQPFVRLKFSKGQWREIGVQVEGDSLSETFLKEPGSESQKLIADLPTNTTEGYSLDLSLEAETRLWDLFKRNSNWKGIFLTFDYGKSWEELTTLFPKGTARAYFRHRQSDNLLERPGEQDLTCHLCWDRLVSVLRVTGLSRIHLERQESFFMHWAEEELAKIVSKNPGQFDHSRNALREILHPNQMGRAFQVLHGRKEESCN